ncbi:MAG TPA: 2-dehydropantoate 2-reductase [Thermoplasmata archaeon]|nr:2-dehydropantoate 2-reductase [Thermoplasmata archaeon]
MGSVLVLGAGAVGSLFGARLAAAGESVLLVGRPAHVAAIRAHGLRVEGVDPGTFRLPALTQVARDAAPDEVLVTVKAYDLVDALTGLAKVVAPTPTALLGNGLGIEGVAARALREAGWSHPEAVLVRAVQTVPATFLGPGRVRATGTGEVVLPEPASAGAAGAAVETFVGLLRRGGFSVRTSPTFELELWRKVAVNAAINPVTAIRRVPNGALLDGPPRQEAELLLAEAVEVARRSGVDLTVDTARADFERIVRSTAENRSSMLQDVDRGRPTELDAISGEILRRGGQVGLDLPATRKAIDDVRRALAASPPSAQR